MTSPQQVQQADRSRTLGRSVMVTGCSSGIGRLSAIELAKQGWNVIAGVRRQEDCQSLLNEQPANLTPVLVDIASQESVLAACEIVDDLTKDHGLDALVNNAGILIPGPLELITQQQLQQQFEVNVFGTHRITQRLLPQLRRAATKGHPSRLVLISSISGRITPPFFGAYAASKHALEAMAEAWRLELSPWNIAVSVVQPDSVATPIWDKACSNIDPTHNGGNAESQELYASVIRNTRRQSLTYKRVGLTTEVVVRSILHSLNDRRPKPYYRVGWRTRAALMAHCILPTSWMDFVLRKSVGG
jgi:NAD(P)-dependent dehydrogenase (short-subunit alcohol dehydrogenase family)